jgi:hypothetical protein
MNDFFSKIISTSLLATLTLLLATLILFFIAMFFRGLSYLNDYFGGGQQTLGLLVGVFILLIFYVFME